MISSYIKSIIKCADLLVTNLMENYAGTGKEIDLVPHLEMCSVRGICSTLFGMDLTDQRINDIYKNTSVIFEL